MRVMGRGVMLAAVFAVALVGARNVEVRIAASTAAVGFGGAVLVGDDEVFSAEAANNFRPGMVYVFRKTGSAWQQAQVLTAPNAAVLDQFLAYASDPANGIWLDTVEAIARYVKERGARP